MSGRGFAMPNDENRVFPKPTSELHTFSQWVRDWINQAEAVTLGPTHALSTADREEVIERCEDAKAYGDGS